MTLGVWFGLCWVWVGFGFGFDLNLVWVWVGLVWFVWVLVRFSLVWFGSAWLVEYVDTGSRTYCSCRTITPPPSNGGSKDKI